MICSTRFYRGRLDFFYSLRALSPKVPARQSPGCNSCVPRDTSHGIWAIVLHFALDIHGSYPSSCDSHPSSTRGRRIIGSHWEPLQCGPGEAPKLGKANGVVSPQLNGQAIPLSTSSLSRQADAKAVEVNVPESEKQVFDNGFKICGKRRTRRWKSSSVVGRISVREGCGRNSGEAKEQDRDSGRVLLFWSRRCWISWEKDFWKLIYGLSCLPKDLF